MRARVVALAVALAAPVAHAHPLSFGLLELRDLGDGRVAVTWRFSGTEGSLVGARYAMPSWCEARSVSRDAVAEGESERAVWACGARGVAGADVAVRGMEGSGVQVAARYVAPGGRVSEALLDDATRVWRVPERPSRAALLERYVALGVEHIATGWDHLAFVALLALLARSRRGLVAAVTAFTAGHSVTLALAALGVVRAPTRAVEAAIAWSLVVAAREFLARPPERRGEAWPMAAGFGLLHGFGFAGALAETGLPDEAIAPALLAFNVGVELGQLAFVLCLAALAWAASRGDRSLLRARRATAWCLGMAGATACLARILGPTG